MKNTICSTIALASIFLFSACGDSDLDSDSFSYDLRGTWVSNSPEYSGYEGALSIDRDNVSITGYAGYMGGKDEATRPFAAFTKNARLKGYAKEDKFFIRDAGLWQELPYIYYEDESYPPVCFLRFSFGGRNETLRKIEIE